MGDARRYNIRFYEHNPSGPNCRTLEEGGLDIENCQSQSTKRASIFGIEIRCQGYSLCLLIGSDNFSREISALNIAYS